MPRSARKDLKTNFFHIMVQGINKEYIFNTETYMKKYERLIFSNLKKCDIQLLAYCIMNNHAHILIYTEKIEEMSKFMKSVNTSFSMYYNVKKNRVGIVFRNRYTSEPIINRQHLLNCVAYIHNNPVNAKMVEHPSQYKHSSYKRYVEDMMDEKSLKLVFGCTEGYMKTFDFIHKNAKEEFMEFEEKIDYTEKINSIVKSDLKKIKSNNGIFNLTIRKLYFEEKIPINEICKYFSITRYKVYKTIK